MARKKATHQAKEPKRMGIQPPEQSNTSMDEKLERLNDRRVKEMHERRIRVGTPIQANEALDVDVKENKQIMCELNELCEGIFGLELKRNVIHTFLQTQMSGEFCGSMGETWESEMVKQEREAEAEIGLLTSVIKELLLKLEAGSEELGIVYSERDEMK